MKWAIVIIELVALAGLVTVLSTPAIQPVYAIDSSAMPTDYSSVSGQQPTALLCTGGQTVSYSETLGCPTPNSTIISGTCNSSKNEVMTGITFDILYYKGPGDPWDLTATSECKLSDGSYVGCSVITGCWVTCSTISNPTSNCKWGTETNGTWTQT